jgi:predicted RecA/RadA family phage recombinase
MSTLQTKGPSGRKMQVVAPTGGIAPNDIVILRSGTAGWCGIAETGAVAGAPATIEYGHQVEVPKEVGTGESFAVGALVYRDASTGKATAGSTGNTLMGAATKAASTSDTKVWVQLKIA